MKRARSIAGFTLLELLVTLALLALMANAMATSTQMSAQVWKRSQDLPRLDAEILLLQQVRTWLTAAKPLDLNQGMRQQFVGLGQGFSLLTNARHPGLLPSEDLWIAVAERRDGLDLRLEAWAQAKEPRVLERRSLDLRSGQFIGFRYLDPDQKSWEVTWTRRDRLPAIIEAQFQDHALHFALANRSL
ncbi:MAG: prepilin-type N-terminal cleavage/methylation domain-containing protein [Pseudomonadota bacterium]